MLLSKGVAARGISLSAIIFVPAAGILFSKSTFARFIIAEGSAACASFTAGVSAAATNTAAMIAVIMIPLQMSSRI